MSNIVVPAKLRAGDTVRVIAPARSATILSPEVRRFANAAFQELNLAVEFGEHIDDEDVHNSASIKARVDDIHAAFADPNVKAIFTVIGGFNSNQLLGHLDWDLIRKNPKILCGYSDITALSTAVFAMTGMQTYQGPHYSTLGQKKLSPYTLEYIDKCLFKTKRYLVEASSVWTDDRWYRDQETRSPVKNEGYWVIQEGGAKGMILGGNLCTFNLLQGTPYMPSVEQDVVLFAEDDGMTDIKLFDRDLESFLQTDLGYKIKGLVLGRFQKASEITREQITEMIARKPRLANCPVIANVDFGHTDPMITFPIGGSVTIFTTNSTPTITIGSQ